MKFMYFFDDKIKAHILKGKKYCNPSNTGILYDGISCIRQNDVNMWFYTKGDTTIAIDAGHLNFPNMDKKFNKIHINPNMIKHVFLTHADVDHCGGVDITGVNIFPNANIYLGAKERVYLDRSTYRIKRLGIKIYNCVSISKNYYALLDKQIIDIDGIKVEALHIPGHTLGHMCYIVDDKVLFSGDCLAINENGGYSFFELFTQYPDMNKKSLVRLKKIVLASNVKHICTGHSGIHSDIQKAFNHIDESASASLKKPFDKNAPDDFRENKHNNQ